MRCAVSPLLPFERHHTQVISSAKRRWAGGAIGRTKQAPTILEFPVYRSARARHPTDRKFSSLGHFTVTRGRHTAGIQRKLGRKWVKWSGAIKIRKTPKNPKSGTPNPKFALKKDCFERLFEFILYPCRGPTVSSCRRRQRVNKKEVRRTLYSFS